MIENQENQTEQIESGVRDFFHRIPEAIKDSKETHPDDDGFDSEHHMLVTD